jgi:hypothetical protein
MARRPGPRERSIGGFLVGPTFLGGKAFPERQAMLGETFLSPSPLGREVALLDRCCQA